MPDPAPGKAERWPSDPLVASSLSTAGALRSPLALAGGGAGDERPASLDGLGKLLIDERLDRVADGDTADAILGCKLVFGWQAHACGQAPRGDVRAEGVGHLLPERPRCVVIDPRGPVLQRHAIRLDGVKVAMRGSLALNQRGRVLAPS